MEKSTSKTAQSTINRMPLKWPEVEKARNEIQSTFGFVPDFVSRLTDQSLPGAWNEIKNVYFDPNTMLEPKLKDFISLGVASQIPCDKTTYFAQMASQSHAATEQERCEAITMAAITRHWSTILNGSLIEKYEFRKEADKIMAYVKKMMEGFRSNMPPEETFLVNFSTPKETYQDIEQTLGLVPKFFLLFPDSGIGGAWSEFKGLQLNPYTALNGKQKELIGLSVAAQIPCEFCIYFHRSAAALNGASELEVQESLANAAITRHWSAIFNGAQIELDAFKRDADRILNVGSQQQYHS